MAYQKQTALKIARHFVRYVNKNYKKVSRAFLFGSYAKGHARSGSDIDVAIISPAFSRDAYRDQIALIKLKMKINLDVEPHPFHPKSFVEEDPIVWEIKEHGIPLR